MLIKTREKNKNIMVIDYSSVLYTILHGSLNWYKDNIDDSIFNEQLYKFDFAQDEEYFGYVLQLFTDKIKEMKQETNIEDNKSIFICTDCSRKDIWRRDIYREYKADRDIKPPTEPNFSTVFKKFKEEVLPKLEEHSVNVLGHVKCEADDIISVVVKQFKSINKTDTCYIISNDSDLYQLVTDNVIMIKTRNNSKLPIVTPDIVEDKYLLRKCILGDKSDNIPKCFEKVKGHKVFGRGCGEKAVDKLVEDKELLLECFKEFKQAAEQFKLNKQLIMLENLPTNYYNEIIVTVFDKLRNFEND